MAKALNVKQQKALLDKIVIDSKSEQGYSVVDTEHANALATTGNILINPSIDAGAGKSAVRAVDSLLAAPVSEPATESAPQFELMDGLDLAPSKRGGRTDEKYPFGKLNVGGSFLVVANASHPNPAKTFQSTVSSATRRFSVESATETRTTRSGAVVPVLVPTKKFTMRVVIKGFTHSNGYVEPADGVRVYRTA